MEYVHGPLCAVLFWLYAPFKLATYGIHVFTRIIDSYKKLHIVQWLFSPQGFATIMLTHSPMVHSCSIVTLPPQHYDDVIMTTIASQITSLTSVYSNVYSDADQRKHQSSASLAFVWGIHRDRWIPRTKGQLRGKCFHLMTSSWKTGILREDKVNTISAPCVSWLSAVMVLAM